MSTKIEFSTLVVALSKPVYLINHEYIYIKNHTNEYIQIMIKIILQE